MNPNSNPRKLALFALMLALLGIPVLGIVTGPLAMVMAAVALGQMSMLPGAKGKSVAYVAILIGFFDALIWFQVCTYIASPKFDFQTGKSIDEIISRPINDFSHLPVEIRSALENNVFFEVDEKLPLGIIADKYTGAGIILSRSPEGEIIITNRHVIDPYYKNRSLLAAFTELSITTYFSNGDSKKARCVWYGPDEINLALVATGTVPGSVSFPEAVTPGAVIGQRVFAIGNPHDLTWSYTEGAVSSIRESTGPEKLKLIQTQTPINPGNSGGGLYSTKGELLGIVTWTKEKAQSEGISFAITYEDFLRLYRKD
jgi:S1-C subfamily serine protease